MPRTWQTRKKEQEENRKDEGKKRKTNETKK
jgi:hypothetical protein